MRKVPLFGAIAGLLVGAATSARAEIATELEPEYAEAVLAFNARDYDRAHRILLQLQQKSPKTPEFLELRAITYKAANQTAEAAEIYRNLVQLKMKSGNQKKEIAPYAFELGVIRFNEKKYVQAEQYLQYAVRSEFNVEASNLYLGMVGIQTQSWDKAEAALLQVLDGSLDELKPAAHFYLGQVYFQKQIPSNGFGQLVTAKQKAQAYVARSDVSADSKSMSEQIIKGVDTALEPLNRTQKFANVSVTVGYDSNVLLVPNESDAAASGTAESTIKTTFSGAAGLATSPLNSLQFVPSFRFNANKNFNQDTASGEFSETGLSLFVTRHALAPVSYGAKLDGAVTFQKEYNQSTDSSMYRLYNTTLSVGPYLKYDRHPKWTFNADLAARLIRFNGDEDLTENLRRNGPQYALRLSGQPKSVKRYFNPTYAIKAEYTDTSGTEFRSLAFGGTIGNTFRLKTIQLIQSLDLTRTDYGDSTSSRGDTQLALVIAGHRKFGDHWAALASIDYTKNSSSDETAYAYNRYTANLGVSYQF